MKRIVPVVLLLLSCGISTAFAGAPGLYRAPASARPLALPAAPRQAESALQCWVGVPDNSYIQFETMRLGVAWTLPAGTHLSRVGFWITGWQEMHGPTPFELELWDMETCTQVWEKPGLWAPDAFDGPTYCEVDLCEDHLVVGGKVGLLVRPMLESMSTMWPMLLTEPSDDRGCESYIANVGSWAPTWCERTYGNFLFRLDVNDCPVPVRTRSWGELKTHYR